VTYISTAEDSKEASHALKSRDRSRVKFILKLRKNNEEGNADDALFSPQSDKDVSLLHIHSGSCRDYESTIQTLKELNE
jgi:hypothetical protein